MGCCASSSSTTVDDAPFITTGTTVHTDFAPLHAGSPRFADRIAVAPYSPLDTRHRITITLREGTIEELELELQRMSALQHNMALTMHDGNGHTPFDMTRDPEQINLMKTFMRREEG